ncbi:hypothetical protein [Sphingomonas sp. CARO-RG-8B-R24-01]|uniref:hypothetical protein n=1 Tax=Sphingomonas sp. CARO-RG-8B-R24-01 TaxID=2914831 RepID=UPI001F55CFD2|nr:hypothetical protein [Sphingomonas sp. CARO-RG-8B-R24-01]
MSDRFHDAEVAPQCSSVVPGNRDVNEAEFRAAMLSGLARCSNTAAKKRSLAGAMDLSSKGLENIQLRGAVPGPKRLWDATAACPHALDDIADLYGFELVRKSGDTATDGNGTLPIATLLALVAEAEAPGSEGGKVKTHRELLRMEPNIRRVHALTAQWIKEITDIRAETGLRSIQN